MYSSHSDLENCSDKMYLPEVEDISDAESEYYEFTLPTDVDLPDFINTARKWNDKIYETNTLPLWSNLMYSVKDSNVSEEDKEQIIWYLAEDLLHVHGMDTFLNHLY